MLDKPTVAFGATYTTDDEAEFLVTTALNVGYRTINACLAYHNIRGMGKAISKSGIPRDEITIIVLDENERRSCEEPRDFDGYKATMEQIFGSLELLAVDQLDLYQINWPVPRYMGNVWENLNADTWRAMEDCVEKGLIKQIGVSNFLPYHLDALRKTAQLPPSANQLEIHPQFQQRETVAYSRSLSMDIYAWSPLFKGKSVALPLINELASKYGKSAAQMILRWDIQNNITPVVNSKNEVRIRENFKVFDFEISEEDMTAIDLLETGEHFDNWSYARQLESIRGED